MESANAQLQEYAVTVEELAIARGINRFSGVVHDSVGHTMTVLISLIGVCSLACEKDIGTVKQKLEEMMNVALKGHQELKRSVQGIMPEVQSGSGLFRVSFYCPKILKKTRVKFSMMVPGVSR